MNWELEIAFSAKREMHKLSDDILQRINYKILTLLENPFQRGAKKLQLRNGYRIRIGDWRVLYDCDVKEKKIYIFAVGHRSKVYK